MGSNQGGTGGGAAGGGTRQVNWTRMQRDSASGYGTSGGASARRQMIQTAQEVMRNASEYTYNTVSGARRILQEAGLLR